MVEGSIWTGSDQRWDGEDIGSDRFGSGQGQRGWREDKTKNGHQAVRARDKYFFFLNLE